MGDKRRLVFIDIETTGLRPEVDRILEIAARVVDAADLRDVKAAAEQCRQCAVHMDTCTVGGPGIPIYGIVLGQPEEVLASMDEWCRRTHEESRLLASVRNSQGESESGAWETSTSVVEKTLLLWLKHAGFEPGQAILAGNSVHFDRSFIRRWMPDLDASLHHRLFDVSTLRQFVLMTAALGSEACEMALSRRSSSSDRSPAHRAMADVADCLEEYAAYLRAGVAS